MKKILLIACTTFLLFACKDKKKSVEVEKSSPIVQAESHKELYGFWVGDFVDTDEEAMDSYLDKLNIIIKRNNQR